MLVRPRIGTKIGLLLVAIAAAILGLASPALAKGGGTTTTPGCATITSWTPTVETVNGQPWVALYVGVFNGCVDEGGTKMPAVSLTSTDTATGKWLGASVIMASYGQNTYRFSIGSTTATPPPVTLTLTVTRPNGAVQDSRTSTVADVISAALAAQPAV